jgi:dUTPase
MINNSIRLLRMSSYDNKSNSIPILFANPSLTRMTSVASSGNIASSPSVLAIDQLPETVHLLSKCHQFMRLKIFVDGPNELHKTYLNAVADHNAHILEQEYVDSGFDLFAPVTTACKRGSINKIDFKLKCSAQMVYDFGAGCRVANSGYYMYPRSSLSKSSLRLANSVGIIDAGYRGNVMGMFDCITDEYEVIQFDRLVQICAPGLVPIFVEMVDNTDELGASARGAGGFGSTGR